MAAPVRAFSGLSANTPQATPDEEESLSPVRITSRGIDLIDTVAFAETALITVEKNLIPATHHTVGVLIGLKSPMNQHWYQARVEEVARAAIILRLKFPT